MAKVVHVIGNGDTASLYKPAKGLKVTCNVPPFAVPDVWGTCIVDFKMMVAMREGSVMPPGQWILGARPHKYMELNPNMRIQWMNHIREYYTVLPKYAGNFTNFNCGHMAVHYAANRLKGEEIHMYGFDSIFDFNLRSYTDMVLNSDRGNTNNLRLANNWRPIWTEMFKEFKDTKFVLHHKHNESKIPLPENVEVHVSSKK
jgi:hypothetical protein